MNNLLRAALLAAAASAAMPATAASVINPDHTISLDTSAPFSWKMTYNGFMSSAQNPIPGLGAEITWNFLGATGNKLNFSYTIANLSGAPFTAARITAFGFSTDPDFKTATAGGNDLFNVVSSGNQPNGLPRLDFCLKDQGNTNNCTGAQAGLTMGQSASGTIVLEMHNLVTRLAMTNFSVRYQGIEPGGQSASGVPTLTGSVPIFQTGVPEPATWALMIGGFGAVGAVARRRRPAIAYA